jgi:hypothetical protein
MTSKAAWIAGILIAAFIAVVVVKALVFPSPTEPTSATRKPGFMDLIEMEAPITDILDRTPQGPGNAGDDYSRAVAAYHDNEQIIPKPTPAVKASITIINEDAVDAMTEIYRHVSAGAAKKDMKYLAVHTPGKLRVSPYLKEVTPLLRAAESVDLLARHLLANNRRKQAEAIHKDLLIMGRHMVNARSHLDMVNSGTLIQFDAMQGLVRAYDSMETKDKNFKKRRLAALREYFAALNEFDRRYGTKLEVLWKVRPNPGDVFNIARNDKDHAWRVQAILCMGILRYTASNRNDTRRNNEMIEKYLNSSDPLEAAAAKAAKELSKADFNQLATAE